VNATQDESTVRKLLATRKRKANVEMTLPIVCKDTLLGRQLFPYPAVPKVVWIDQESYYRSFTNSSYVNEKTIAAIIDRKRIAMFQLRTLDPKETPYFNFKRSKLRDSTKPLFINGNGEESRFMPLVTQSVLTGKIDGLMEVFYQLRRDTIRDLTTVTMHGSIEMMYKVAFNKSNFSELNNSPHLEWLLDNRIDWKVSNPNFLYRKPSGETNYDYYYCYQLTARPTSRKRLQEIIQFDLKKYFGLDAYLEKRKLQCLVLTVKDTSLLKRKTEQQYEKEERIGRFRSIDHLIYTLSYGEYYKSPYPIIDETGFKGPLSGFRIFPDPVVFDGELQKSGLSLSFQDREIDILVVKEPEGYKFPHELEYNNIIDKLEWKYSHNSN
jgi:hypothetical protein